MITLKFNTMKTAITVLLFSFIILGSYAQGVKVIYNEQIKASPIEIKSGNQGVSGITITTSSSNEKNQGKRKVLYIYKEQSLYEPYITQSEASIQENIDSKYKVPEISSIVHKNKKTNQLVAQETLADKKYLLSEPLTDFGWNLVNEEKKINDYTCKKAVDASGTVTAWYCPDIEVKDGPGIYYGLPGLILQIEKKEGNITAQEIDTDYAPTKRIIAPVSGEKMNRKAFEELKKKTTEEMGIQSNGNIIKIKTN